MVKGAGKEGEVGKHETIRYSRVVDVLRSLSFPALGSQGLMGINQASDDRGNRFIKSRPCLAAHSDDLAFLGHVYVAVPHPGWHVVFPGCFLYVFLPFPHKCD